ncbi:Retinol dehydrogenase 11 [Spatholobus suberectus]|nr:Retinol dehydrogenase 11 [Spatholobus suberectus]
MVMIFTSGATVYLVCRNKEKGEAALSDIQTKTGNQNVYLEICDLSSVNEIKSFASRFSKKNVPVHVLVNSQLYFKKTSCDICGLLMDTVLFQEITIYNFYYISFNKNLIVDMVIILW